MSVRVRYAPSPTGEPHLGNVRTAVYDYLFARQSDGVFIFRLEDTDQQRYQEGSVEKILESLQWLSIEVNEGIYLDAQGKVAEKGNHGPYTQSHRLDIYQEQAQKLVGSGQAYRCFCSVERLELLRNEQQKNHLPPRYDQHCRSIPPEESKKRAESEPFVIRQAMPENETIIFDDLIRGEISFQSNELDDHVLLKSDGFPTYQLANVVDDHLMEISHVLRGEEWIPSTPKNILLYQAFGWEPPQYAHLPLILGTDKTKLSKRHGAEPVLAYRDKGYLPAAVLNVIAFLGWSPGTEAEFFSLEDLIKSFQLEKVQKSPAVFNLERLDYVNGWYIRNLPVGEVTEKMIPWLLEANLIKKEEESYSPVQELHLPSKHFTDYLLSVAATVQQRLKHFDETVEVSHFFFARPQIGTELKTLIVPKNSTLEEVTSTLQKVVELLENHDKDDWIRDRLEEKLHLFIQKEGLKNNQILWPIRAALTGVPASPGAFEMLAILGKEESLVRLNGALTA